MSLSPCQSQELLEFLRQQQDNAVVHLPAFLRDLPISGSQESNCALLIQLRLAHFLVRSQGHCDLSGQANDIVQYICRSIESREQQARELLDQVCRLGNTKIIPIKFAALLGTEPTERHRYFRDLDFAVARHDFLEVVAHLRDLGFTPGDIDPENWNQYLAVEDRKLTDDLTKLNEVHFFAVYPFEDPTLERGKNELTSRWPNLNELQFYGNVSDQFVRRCFIDIEIDDGATNDTCHTPQADYVIHALGHAIKDVSKGRVGVNQILWLETALKDETVPEMVPAIGEFLYGLDSPVAPKSNLRENVESATIAFIVEKMQTIVEHGA